MKKTILLLICMFFLVAGTAWASGFRIPEQSANAMGMGNAWVAQADDPSAIFMNPAGIAQLGRPAIAGGLIIVAPLLEHTNNAGAAEDGEKNLYFPPYLFTTCNMGTSNMAFGIGVSAPFGLGTEWADDGFARYSSTLTEIELFNVNPTLAYKVSDSFFVGIGLDYYNSSVTIKRKVPWGMSTFALTMDPASLAIPDGGFSMKGSGEGWGYNAGILYKFSDDYFFGLAYRSAVTVEYDGDADLTDIGGAGLVQFGNTSFSTAGNAEIEYPAMIQVGFAANVLPQFLLEIDVEWTGWSSYDQLTLDFESPLLADSTSEKDWDDTLTYRLGLEYALNDSWDLRAGYLFDSSPIPDEHYDTMLPDGEARHALSGGFGYSFGRFSVDASYMALFLTERTIKENNAEYNPQVTDTTGKYKGFSHLFALGLSYSF